MAVVSHYNVAPVIDIFGAVAGRDLGGVAGDINKIIDATRQQLPRGSRVVVRGQVQTMRASYVGQKSADDPFAQVRVAEAAGLLDGAWLALERNMTELMGYVRAGEKIPLPLRLRVRRDQVTGTGQAIRAVDLLFENSGGRALKMGTPIQRFWRDAHAGRVHAINDPERALSMFGRGEFGHDVPPDAMF